MMNVRLIADEGAARPLVNSRRLVMVRLSRAIFNGMATVANRARGSWDRRGHLL